MKSYGQPNYYPLSYISHIIFKRARPRASIPSCSTNSFATTPCLQTSITLPCFASRLTLHLLCLHDLHVLLGSFNNPLMCCKSASNICDLRLCLRNLHVLLGSLHKPLMSCPVSSFTSFQTPWQSTCLLLIAKNIIF